MSEEARKDLETICQAVKDSSELGAAIRIAVEMHLAGTVGKTVGQEAEHATR